MYRNVIAKSIMKFNRTLCSVCEVIES